MIVDLDKTLTLAQMGAEAIIGKEWFIYRRADESLFSSIIEPEQWGDRFQLEFVGAIMYGADQTWSVTRRAEQVDGNENE